MDIEPSPHSGTAMCGNCHNVFEHVNYPIDAALSALRHNYSPGGDEASDILRAIKTIDSEFGRYDPELSRLQAILASLQERRRTLKWYQDCCRSVLSPVRKLPPEILQTIFTCRELGPDIIPNVGQVCRHWRDVTIGTPKLWCNISVGRTRFTFTDRYDKLASLFLERSANQPLSISIRNPADSRLVNRLSRHANRWQTLRLSTTAIDFYSSLSLNTLDLGALEKFEVVEADTMDGDFDGIVAVSLNPPKLYDVVLKNPLQLWSLPWGQLTRIQYDVPTTADAMQIFQLCPQLVDCSLDRLREATEAEFSFLRPSRKLQFLRLAIDTTNRETTRSPETILKAFLTCLNAPNLLSLELIGQWNPTELTGFLSRSECQLENLTLRTGYMRDEKIIRVLESLPLLKTLILDTDVGTSRYLQNHAITDKLLRRLIFYPDSDSLLPSLTHLALKTSLTFENRVLLDVIESRWIPWVTELYGVPVSRLISVDLHFCGKKQELDPLTIEELREDWAAGLRVTLQQGAERISMLSSDNSPLL